MVLYPPIGPRMAPKATVHKAMLEVSDIDRHYYASHALTLAQHPSETDQRLMVRVLAFALHAHERLAFGRGLSSDDEPDLWRKSLSGEIEQWIELGQPEESRLRKACGRAREVVVIGYSGRGFDLWWEKNGTSLARLDNLAVVDLPAGAADALAALLVRNLSLQCLIQDGHVQLIGKDAAFDLAPTVRKASIVPG